MEEREGQGRGQGPKMDGIKPRNVSVEDHSRLRNYLVRELGRGRRGVVERGEILMLTLEAWVPSEVDICLFPFLRICIIHITHSHHQQ